MQCVLSGYGHGCRQPLCGATKAWKKLRMQLHAAFNAPALSMLTYLMLCDTRAHYA